MARNVTLFTGQWADLTLETMAQKAKREIVFQSGEEVEKMIADALDQPPEVISFLKKMVE